LPRALGNHSRRLLFATNGGMYHPDNSPVGLYVEAGREARFLLQYFRTEEGFGRIQDASPGGAGRNRTLGLDALAKIEVPLPSIERQRWFSQLHARAEHLVSERERMNILYDALVPAILERTFHPAAPAADPSDEPAVTYASADGH
jgi:hypothetical protein